MRDRDVAARVELSRGCRGKVTDLAVGEGGLETALRAIEHAMGVAGTLEELHVTGMRDPAQGVWWVAASVSVKVGQVSLPGWSRGSDILSACCDAYIRALDLIDKVDARASRGA